jgi:hypothetical protein
MWKLNNEKLLARKRVCVNIGKKLVLIVCIFFMWKYVMDIFQNLVTQKARFEGYRMYFKICYDNSKSRLV